MVAINLFDTAARWQLALDTAERATDLAITPPVQAQLAGEQVALRRERVEVAAELRSLARMCSVDPAPRLPQGPVTARDLGLPPGTEACIADLDGVLTDSGRLHAEAWRFLETARYAGIGCAVLSASTSTVAMLELTGLNELVDARIHADARPAPDAVLAACEHLGATPARAATLTHTPAGVAAGLAAGTTVVGIAAGDDAERLAVFGAHRVVPSVAALIDPRLRSSADPRLELAPK